MKGEEKIRGMKWKGRERGKKGGRKENYREKGEKIERK